MYLYKTETNISNYCKFKLTTDIEKNPGPTPLYPTLQIYSMTRIVIDINSID